MIFIIIYHLLSSLMLVATKIATQYGSPLVITAIRTFIAAIVTFSCYLFFNTKNSSWRSLTVSDWVGIAVVGLFHSFFRSVLSFWSMHYLTTSTIAFVIYLTPFVCAGLSYILFGEKITINKWLGMIIGFIGILVLESNRVYPISSHYEIIPILILLCAVICNAIGMIFMRYLLSNRHVPILLLNSGSLLFSHCLSLIMLLTFPSLRKVSWNHVLIFVAVITAISCLHSLIIYMKSALLKKYSVTFISITYFMMPLWSCLLGYIFFGDVINCVHIIAFFIITCGLYIFYQEECVH